MMDQQDLQFQQLEAKMDHLITGMEALALISGIIGGVVSGVLASYVYDRVVKKPVRVCRATDLRKCPSKKKCKC